MIVDIDRDFGTGVTFASLVGQLTLATVPNVSTTLNKLAAECPTALILDLRAIAPVRTTLLTVFATSAQRAASEYGVPVLACECSEDVANHLRRYGPLIIVHASREEATAAVYGAGVRWRHLRLEPDATAAAQARRLVHDACTAWGVEHLGNAARLVVSELVNNAVVHARTTLDASVASNGKFLRIAVRDGSPVQPRLVLDSLLAPALARHGWGLRLVQEYSDLRGSARIDGGKIVWAHLALDAELRR